MSAIPPLLPAPALASAPAAPLAAEAHGQGEAAPDFAADNGRHQ